MLESCLIDTNGECGKVDGRRKRLVRIEVLSRHRLQSACFKPQPENRTQPSIVLTDFLSAVVSVLTRPRERKIPHPPPHCGLSGNKAVPFLLPRAQFGSGLNGPHLHLQSDVVGGGQVLCLSTDTIVVMDNSKFPNMPIRPHNVTSYAATLFSTPAQVVGDMVVDSSGSSIEGTLDKVQLMWQYQPHIVEDKRKLNVARCEQSRVLKRSLKGGMAKNFGIPTVPSKAWAKSFACSVIPDSVMCPPLEFPNLGVPELDKCFTGSELRAALNRVQHTLVGPDNVSYGKATLSAPNIPVFGSLVHHEISVLDHTTPKAGFFRIEGSTVLAASPTTDKRLEISLAVQELASYTCQLGMFSSSAKGGSSFGSFQTLAVTVPKPFVYQVELNRPQKLNAMSNTMWLEIGQCFSELGDNAECRAIVLSGSGKIFCAGIDFIDLMELSKIVVEHEDIARRSNALRKQIKRYQDSITSLEKRLPKIIGSDSLVRELSYTARKMLAPEAKECGLVSRVFDNKDSLFEGALNVATDIATKSPVAVQLTKRNLVYSRDHTVEEGLEYIANWNMTMLQSEDFANASMAQATKTPPPNFSKL
uniref:3-hydroxyisobutyryl-CoA hydrolase n=1 Tax=Timema californicum TaxID=61474 RepID=A0A7R9IVT9_TIMCA|nr:unnamed protein product [Timema californicum]